ncbi:hypothetical protein OXX80_008778, partial [Metschnikowia pulcherrima]
MSQRRNNKNNKKGSTAAEASPAKDTQLQMLAEMFPDWEAEDLASLLAEHRNDVEVVIDLIVNNKVQKWEPIKKESRSKRRDDAAKPSDHAHSAAPHNTAAHTASSG